MMSDNSTSSESRKTPELSRWPEIGHLSASERGMVIAVYGTRADLGVTTIASSLALAFLSLGGGPIALVEFDQRSVRARADRARVVTPARGTSRNGREHSSEERVMIPGTDAGLARRSDGVWTFAPARRRTPSLSDAKSVGVALDAMRSTFTVSVVVLEHQVNERTLAAFDLADRIVMVTEGSVPSLRGTQRVLRLCRRLNYPDEKMCVVVNRYDAAGTMAVADIAAILKREVFWKLQAGEAPDATGLAQKLRN